MTLVAQGHERQEELVDQAVCGSSEKNSPVPPAANSAVAP
jgi:hypothetical protein